MIDWSDFGAVLFDLDGVITPTADVHEVAWGELFAEFEFTQHDYLTHVDGRPRVRRRAIVPRQSSVRTARGRSVRSAWRRHDLRTGESQERCCSTRSSNATGSSPTPARSECSTLLDRLGTPQAIVSSSKNARMVLGAAGMGDRFDHIVDGIRVVDEGLTGKPAPDMFVRGAELLGVPADRCIVVEDAVSGRTGRCRRSLRIRARCRPRRSCRVVASGRRRPGRVRPERHVASDADTTDERPRHEDQGHHRGDRPASFPDRPLAPDRDGTRSDRSGADRDTVRGRQRLPRHARRTERDAERHTPRNVRERLPRDLADRVPGNRPCVRHHGSDDRQRSRRQTDADHRRRPTAAARRRRSRGVRTNPRSAAMDACGSTSSGAHMPVPECE